MLSDPVGRSLPKYCSAGWNFSQTKVLQTDGVTEGTLTTVTRGSIKVEPHPYRSREKVFRTC